MEYAPGREMVVVGAVAAAAAADCAGTDGVVVDAADADARCCWRWWCGGADGDGD